MALSRLLSSFRVRLLLLLAALLVLTLGVQYYLNQRAVRANTKFIVEQQQAVMAGVALGVNSFSSGGLYLDEVRKQSNDPLLDRVKSVLIVDEQGNIKDSLDESQRPFKNSDNSIGYVKVKDISLPPLRSALERTSENVPLPEGMTIRHQTTANDSAAFYFPLETEKGRRYVIVVLGSSNTMMSILRSQARQSFLYTLLVLLVTTCLTAIVVWRFTRPIKSLSIGARRIAGGDFSFRVPSSGRSDEMGELSDLFNDMTVKLARTRELEAQLYNAEKAVVVSRLASAIAHEIRNPLNYINLTLDHLRVSFAPADSQKQEKFESLTKQLKAEVARINNRITEFLNYSRPVQLEPQPLDVAELARDALRTFEVQLTESNVETAVVEQTRLPLVMADAESLRSALTNLIINSLQAMDGNGGKISIVLSAEDDGRRARIEVSDTGRGIGEDDILKVFEPYYSTKETGTGLGLAIVKKAVDDHDGTISVKSKEGEGTTFTITLPVSEPGAIATGSRTQS